MRTAKSVEREIGYQLARDGCLGESDRDINALSRYRIRQMRRNHGQAFLYRINLYDKQRGHRDAIYREYKSGMVYNFEFSVVLPVRSAMLVELIYRRDITPYTGTSDDYRRLEAIDNLIQELGGVRLFWT